MCDALCDCVDQFARWSVRINPLLGQSVLFPRPVGLLCLRTRRLELACGVY